jgi:hypothetical protein
MWFSLQRIHRDLPGGELLDSRQIDMPPVRQTSVTFKRAAKAPHAKQKRNGR